MEPSEQAERFWSPVVRALRRPFRVTWSLLLLFALIPCYLVIADLASKSPRSNPELSLDRAIPLQPGWALVYGGFYAFLIVLPVLVLWQEEHIRRSVNSYLVVWTFAYACFLLYPTSAPRPTQVSGDGFAAHGLRFLYGADPPYNCFPSIHVAHSFVSALSCFRLHPGLGGIAIACATVVGLSTLFTKQHYVLDVVAGMALAGVACAVFLGRSFKPVVVETERRDAPAVAVILAIGIALLVGALWIAYLIGVRWH